MQLAVICLVVVDDEIGLEAMQFRPLHLHSGADLCLGCCVAEHCSAKANLFWSINEEDFIDHLAQAALEKNGTLEGNYWLFVLFLSPSLEVLEDDRMDDGVHLACVLDISKEVIGQKLLVEFVPVEHFGTNQGDEFLANLLVRGSQSFGFHIAVIDRNTELLPKDGRNVALSATDASCDTYRLNAVHCCYSPVPPAICSMR